MAETIRDSGCDHGNLILAENLTGLMGQCEMEAAVAVILCVAHEQRLDLDKLCRVRVTEADFEKGSYAHDGFRDLEWHGWLDKFSGAYYPTNALHARLLRRFPHREVRVMRKRPDFDASFG